MSLANRAVDIFQGHFALTFVDFSTDWRWLLVTQRLIALSLEIFPVGNDGVFYEFVFLVPS